MARSLWKNDKVQFARLLCEIMANCDIKKKDFKALCESMDLSADEVNSLLDRADKVWEDTKARILPRL